MDAMLAGMSSADFAGWVAFYELEPWGAVIEDHRAGVLASTVANYAGRHLPDGKSLAPAEFFPRRNVKPPKPMSLAEKARGIFRGLVKRKG